MEEWPLGAESAVILGGGIIGLTCALRLQAQGFAVTLVDPDGPAASASLGNAGHIAVEQAAPLASRRSIMETPRRLFAFGGALDLPLGGFASWAPFAVRLVAASDPARFAAGKSALASWLKEAMPAWRRLTATLEAPDLLLEEGHFVVWESEASAARGVASWAQTGADEAAFRPATDAELAQLRNLIHKPIAQAIRFERTGQVRNLIALRELLFEALRSGGARFIRAKAERILITDHEAEAVLTGGERLGASLLLVAAGVASGRLMRQVGHKAPIIAERGYHIESAADPWPDLPPVVFEDRSLIVTRFSNALRLSSFVEFGAADAPPDKNKWRRLRQHAADLGVPVSEPAREWMGARPTLPDYLPAVGRSERADNLYYAFGHQHLGLTLAPITAEVVAQLAGGRPATPDPAPFDLDRF